MRWRELFCETVVEQGEALVETGNVYVTKWEKDGYKGIVKGEKTYVVKIAKGEVWSVVCSCKVTTKKYYCEHMAAVLYLLEGNNKALEWYKYRIDSSWNVLESLEVESTKMVYVDIPGIISRGNYELAFQTIIYLHDTVCDYVNRYSYCYREFACVIEAMYDLCKQILRKKVDKELENRICNWSGMLEMGTHKNEVKKEKDGEI